MTATFQLTTPFAEGRTSDIYAWENDQILKLYRDWCPPEWIENELKVAQTIHAAGIPTPAAGGIVAANGRRGIVYERISGISMLQDMNNRPWTIFRHARELAKMQAQYQRLDVPGLYSYHASFGNAIRRVPILPEPTRQKLLSRLEKLPDEKTLCHGDFHPGNVILSPHGPVVIDWMTACSGSPWADAARTFVILSVGPRAAGRQLNTITRLFIRLFTRTYLNHYKQLTPQEGMGLNDWLPVVAAARLEEKIEPEREGLLDIVEKGLE